MGRRWAPRVRGGRTAEQAQRAAVKSRLLALAPVEPSAPNPSGLSSKQRAELRSAAHALDPVVHVGKEGITPAFLHMLADAFRTRELLKVKVLEMAPNDAKGTAAELADTLVDTHVVQVLGRVVTLYRPNADLHREARPEAPFKAAPGRPVKKPTKPPTTGAGRRSSGRGGAGRRGGR